MGLLNFADLSRDAAMPQTTLQRYWAKGFRHLSEQTGENFLRGILLYTGSTSVTFGTNLHAVPVCALWRFMGHT